MKKILILMLMLVGPLAMASCGDDEQKVAELPEIVNPEPEKPVEPEKPEVPTAMEMDAKQIVANICVGWNLGNTCESGTWEGWSGDNLDIETAWGNPKTTRQMFTALKEAGFNAVRIPVRWCVHADEDMNINERWMARVKEIVDYAMTQDMYVILNSHHDTWYDRLPRSYNEKIIKQKFAKMWQQIAETFRDYGDHLIFAGMNEVITKDGDKEYWSGPVGHEEQLIADLAQLFVRTVRETGGNNQYRSLMVQCYACNPEFGLKDSFTMPNDKVEGRLIFEYHCYNPYNYATLKTQHEVSDKDKEDLKKLFARINQKFAANGTPCIMAEFGSTQDNKYSKGEAAADKIRADYHEFVVSEARKQGIASFYWDNGAFSGDGELFGLLDRKSNNFPARARIALDGIMRGAK